MRLSKLIETLGYEDDYVEQDIAIAFYNETLESEDYE